LDQRVITLTDIGQMREENQDAIGYHAYNSTCFFLAVADGMGGYAGGSLASTTVIESLLEEVKKIELEQFIESPTLYLRKVINTANSLVNKKAKDQREFKDMGSTCVCSFVNDGNLVTAHIGDSRAYLLRQGVIKLITEDHTVVQDLVRAGYVSKEDATYHPSSGILTKCLGQMEIADPEFNPPIKLEKGDKVLLCSDGLSGMLDDDEIAEILSYEKSDEATKVLIEMANEAGGFDNITALVFFYGDPEDTEKKWPIRVGVPFYEEDSIENTEEPTVPFKIKAAISKSLKPNKASTSKQDPSADTNWPISKLLPIVASVLILLLALLFWFFGVGL
jgi:PPM family protein phosphatase